MLTEFVEVVKNVFDGLGHRVILEFENFGPGPVCDPGTRTTSLIVALSTLLVLLLFVYYVITFAKFKEELAEIRRRDEAAGSGNTEILNVHVVI